MIIVRDELLGGFKVVTALLGMDELQFSKEQVMVLIIGQEAMVEAISIRLEEAKQERLTE